jgi:5-methylthioadenosine/S-adenosylhomocysteine deaminase
MADILFKNGFFLPNDGTLRKGSMRISGGKIRDLSKSARPKPKDRVVDLSGRLVIPGFVQTHIHLCQTLFRNLADDLALLDWLKTKIWPMEAAHTEQSLYASARLGIAELLAGGTTTILDMGTVRHTDAIFTAMEEMGIRGFSGKCLMDDPATFRGLRESTSTALKENRLLADRWHGAAKGRLGYAPAPRFLLSCTNQLMKALQEEAAHRKCLVHSHSSENREEVAAVRKRYGKENIEAFQQLGFANGQLVLAHCIWLSENEKQILAEAKIKVAHCPGSNLKLASGIAPVPELMKRGIHLSLGADGAPCNNRLSAFSEMRLASLIQKPLHGPTAMEAKNVFEMATLGGAKALGLEEMVGRLQPGFAADFVVIDAATPGWNLLLQEGHPNPVYSGLVFGGGVEAVEETWVNGRLVYNKGRYPGLSTDQMHKSALRQLSSLLRRAGLSA